MRLTINLYYLLSEDHTNDNSLCIIYFSVTYHISLLMLENVTFILPYLGTHLCALHIGGAIESYIAHLNF